MSEPTFFDSGKRPFEKVPVTDGKIATTEFLEASEDVVCLFDRLGSAAFAPVQKDMAGNIKKVRERQLAHATESATLKDLVSNELAEKKHTATEGLLWLYRGLDFTAKALRNNVNVSDEELTTSFTNAYNDTLKKHHNMLVKGVFGLAMKACPYRNDFYKKLGSDDAKVQTQMAQWLAGLESVLAVLGPFIEGTKW